MKATPRKTFAHALPELNLSAIRAYLASLKKQNRSFGFNNDLFDRFLIPIPFTPQPKEHYEKKSH